MFRPKILLVMTLASLLLLSLAACVERESEDDDSTAGDRPVPTPAPTEQSSDDDDAAHDASDDQSVPTPEPTQPVDNSDPDPTATPGADDGEWFLLLETDKTYPEDSVGDQILELTESAEEYEEWRERFQLEEISGSDDIDWDEQVVLFVGTGESGSCPVELVDVQFDEDERLIDVMVSQEAPPETMCTMDWTPRVFVIALDKDVPGDGELFGVITDPEREDEEIDPDRLTIIRE